MDIMLDLETLSSEPDAAIVAIGACTFCIDPLERRQFYALVDAESAVAAGGLISPSTVKWWMRQSDQARSIFAESQDEHRLTIEDALTEFEAFVAYSPNARVWGNGASFDNVVLRRAYERIGRKMPWSYKNERCYRTLKALRPDIPPPVIVGVLHNALDDALTQANHAEAILRSMRGEIITVADVPQAKA